MQIKILLALSLVGLFACGSPRPPAEAAGPPVILKLDDAWHERGLIHPGWISVFDYLNEQEVTATIGIVGGRATDAPDAYYDWLRQQAERGHEIWNHGWCHCKPGDTLREFRGTTYAYQLDHLRQTQQLATEKLGLTLTAFGAPYNATDSLTVSALAEVPELEVWMYPHGGADSDKTVLPRTTVNIEYPVHQPDFDQFLAAYEDNLEAPVLVIQGHPRSWHDEPARMAEFQKIIAFLRERNTTFTTPTAYVRSLGENAGATK